MPLDKFGLPFLYPSKSGGFFYQQSDDPNKDAEFDGDVTADGNGEFTMHISGPTDFGILKHPEFQDCIGGCDMDFAATEARGYAYKSDDIRDIEYKMLLNLDDMGSSDDGVSISGTTGHHASNSSPCCQGFAYMINMQYNTNPSLFRFRKEIWHVSYHTDPTYGEWTHPLVNFKLNGHGWFGVCYVRYNKKDGRATGKDSVIVEVWFNPTPEDNPTSWTMLKRVEDKGIGWGDDGDLCNGDKDQVGTWGSAQSRCKSNAPNGDMHIKHVSLREIDPSGSFGDTPNNPPDNPPPDPTTIQGSFKFQWDINTVRTSQCAGTGVGSGGGGEVGNTKFYTVYTDSGVDSDKELSDSSTWQNRKRIVMSPASSSSVFTGKIPIQLDIPLKKVGTPATNNINAKIWNSSGTVVYTSPTNITDSSLTTSYTKQIFDMSTNTHALVSGDRIGIEYLGTSSSNYVVASYKGTSTANTNYYQYEGTTWQSKTRSLVMDVWQ